MVYVDPQACWIAQALLNATGFMAALSAWDVLQSHKYRRLLWLVPIVLACSLLAAYFSPEVTTHALAEKARLAALRHQVTGNLIAFPFLTLVIVLIRRATPFGKTKAAPNSGPVSTGGVGSVDLELRGAVERFTAFADRADIASVTEVYDPEFACVRVADEGGFVHLSREQMLAFWKRHAGAQPAAGGQAVPTQETKIHYAEVIGDTGYVLMTRVKNIGNGWEPMFYNLVWRKQEGQWRLLREFVHQRSVPKWK
jgi:hypothetical protein